jgi:DNA-binding SARP family transcriptional activator
MTEQGQAHPEYRVYTFGGFSLERLIHPSASEEQAPQYAHVAKAAWQRRMAACSLLKVLLCRTRRRASKDELLDLLWPQSDALRASHSLNTAASILRGVLRTHGKESLLLTTHAGDVTIFALPPQQHLWVDADAFEALLDDAMSVERQGQDPLPLLEVAQRLAKGTFLEEDRYSDWTHARRQMIQAAQRRLVHRLADLYLQRAMGDKAEVVLHTFLAEEPTDEDMLCRLMTRLSQQGRRQEALGLYQRTANVLQEELGTQPAADTRALAERIRDEPPVGERTPTYVVSGFATARSVSSPGPTQAIDLLCEPSAALPEQQIGAWLALGVSDLAPLFDAGWTLEALLQTVQLLLQGVEAMPVISRRKLLHLGAMAMLRGIPLPTSDLLSIEERSHLCQAFGENIAAAWMLFHTAGTAQVLAVGQAQLYLVQQHHTVLYPSVLPLFYSGVYRLIGATYHFQGRYQEALQAHEKAYMTALEGADGWNMAQCRSWQAYGWKALGRYADALQATNAALRLISQQGDTESIRLRARLLAFGAENAAILGDVKEVHTRLSASEALLEQLPPLHEEFDRVGWLQWAGICALHLGQHELAITRLQQALDELPAPWIRRCVSTAIPLACALARRKERAATLAIAQRTLPQLKALQARALTQEFLHCLVEDVLVNFPQDTQCQAFVAEAERQLMLAGA